MHTPCLIHVQARFCIRRARHGRAAATGGHGCHRRAPRCMLSGCQPAGRLAIPMHKPYAAHVQAPLCICSVSAIRRAVGRLSGRSSCLTGQACRFKCLTYCISQDICQHDFSHQHLTEGFGSLDGHVMTSISSLRQQARSAAAAHMLVAERFRCWFRSLISRWQEAMMIIVCKAQG